MQTFIHDHSLPALPVPELSATGDGLLALVGPLVDATAFAATRAAARDFFGPGGEGVRLHNLLVEYKNTLPGNASWLRPIWDDNYLTWRDPLPINMNYCFRLADERWGGARALPRLVLALAEAARLLSVGDLPAETCSAGFLAMDQARSCFYTRIACPGRDVLRMTDLAAPPTVAVVCGGRWFIVPLTRADGAPAAEKDLAAAFAAVRREAEADCLASGPAPTCPITAMTATPRDEAALIRASLLDSLQNRLNLDALEKSLLVVCLDPPHSSDNAFIHSLLCGAVASRCFDKSLQVIASEDGRLGANFEHAGCDAAIWVYLLDFCDKSIRAGARNSAAPVERLFYRALHWSVNTDLDSRLEAATRNFAARSTAVALCCEDFAEYSRKDIKQLGTSPDAFLQLGFQAAQYRIFGRLRSSYEAVSVRGFAQGRTECARGNSIEAARFAGALWRAAPARELVDAYRLAENAHKARLLRCQHGLGVERHMTGLAAMHTMHAGAGITSPALFNDPGWLELKHDALSTSGIGAPFIRFFGFGPTTRDGYGIGYAPGPDSTGLVVTSFVNAPEAFTAAFAAYSKPMAALLGDKEQISQNP